MDSKLVNIKPFLISLAIIATSISVVVLWNLFLNSNASDISSVDGYRGLTDFYPRFFNGHMGLFFKLDLLGSVNFLLLPLTVWFAVFRFKIAYKYIREATISLLLFLVVSLNAFFNYRYWLTFSLPVSIIIFYFLYELLGKYGKRYLYITVVLLLVVQVANILAFKFFSKVPGNISNAVSVNSEVSRNDNYFDKLTFKPNRIFLYFKENKINSYVLLNGLPMFYYHSEQPAYNYFANSDVIYTSRGKYRLLNTFLKEDLPIINTKDFKIEYALSTTDHDRLYPEFYKWLLDNFKPLIKDGDFTLYIHNNAIQNSILNP
jgi:hypothetical protein